MSKSNAFETGMLAKVFKATALSWDAEVELTVYLHKEIITDADASTVDECDYTNYAAQDVARTGVGWDVTGDTASNVAAIVFPQCGAVGNTIKGVSITPKNSTVVLYWGELNDELTVSNLIQPQFQIGALTITDLGGGLANVKFRDVNDNTDRVDTNMDESERTNITLDPS
jgi:hypothetical protein